jgi:hypothetical protein
MIWWNLSEWKKENNNSNTSIIIYKKIFKENIINIFEGIDMTLGMLNGSDKPINKRV